MSGGRLPETPRSGPGCRRRLLLLLLLLLLSLPSAQPRSAPRDFQEKVSETTKVTSLPPSSSAWPHMVPEPRQEMLTHPSLPTLRMPLARRPHRGDRHKELVPNVFLGKAVVLELAEKQPEEPPNCQQSHRHLLLLLLRRGRLAPQVCGDATQRRKRHAAAHLRHAQLMRVGCALGTCQVQNLSHRLWQLKGQPGRHDSSPMDPNSPHSYG